MAAEPMHPARPTTDPGTPALVDAGASNGATTDDAGAFPEAVLRRAAGDPGSICRREDGETLPAWIARASATALTRRGLLLTDAQLAQIRAEALRQAAESIERDGGTTLTALWAADELRDMANRKEPSRG